MALSLPIWGGFDEWLHYGYAAYLSRTGQTPAANAPSIPAEIYESLKIAPGDGYETGQPSFPQFWTMQESERSACLSRLRDLRNDRQSALTLSNWQAQHPPLYYAVLSPFYRVMDGRGLAAGVRALRFVSLLLASLALFPFYALLKMFFDDRAAILGLALAACFPSTYILFGRLTNDCLAFPVFTAVVFLALRIRHQGSTPKSSFTLGTLLGLGVLTKLYVLTALPVILFIFFLEFLKSPERRPATLRHFALFALPASAICGLWIMKNLSRFGSWNPTVHVVAARDLGLFDKLKFAALVDWKSFAFSNLIGLLWAGNWSFVTFPSGVYKTFALALMVPAALFIFACVKRNREGRDLSGPLLLAGFSAAFLAGMAYHQLHNRIASNLDSMGGWYWTVLLPGHIALLLFALEPLGRFSRPALAATALAAYVLSLLGTLGMLLPYYTGLLDKPQITTSLFNSFPVGEAFRRIAQLNGLSAGLLPALLATEILLLAGVMLCSSRIWPVAPIAEGGPPPTKSSGGETDGAGFP